MRATFAEDWLIFVWKAIWSHNASHLIKLESEVYFRMLSSVSKLHFSSTRQVLAAVCKTNACIPLALTILSMPPAPSLRNPRSPSSIHEADMGDSAVCEMLLESRRSEHGPQYTLSCHCAAELVCMTASLHADRGGTGRRPPMVRCVHYQVFAAQEHNRPLKHPAPF